MKKLDIKEVLTRNLREAMERRGIDGKTLASKSKISESHISEIRRGLSSPTVMVLNDIAHALGIQPWELLADSDATRENALTTLLWKDKK